MLLALGKFPAPGLSLAVRLLWRGMPRSRGGSSSLGLRRVFAEQDGGKLRENVVYVYTLGEQLVKEWWNAQLEACWTVRISRTCICLLMSGHVVGVVRNQG